MSPDDKEIRARMEAALYAAGRPLKIDELAKAAGITSKRKTLMVVKKIINSLNENMIALEIVEMPMQKFAMQLKTEYTKVARRFSLRPLMSKAMLKTLSHVVYLQPVSGSDLSTRRGPQAYSHLKKLRELGFIKSERLGRTSMYRTTGIFSEYFGLSTDPEKIKVELGSPQVRVKKRKFQKI
jgi:segregation and condensation protein B